MSVQRMGFVSDTTLDGDIRTVTFADGFAVRERIVDIDDKNRRLAYAATGGLAKHHNASMQVLAESDGHSRFVWITDVLPDELAAPIGGRMDAGCAVIKQTLERRGAAK